MRIVIGNFPFNYYVIWTWTIPKPITATETASFSQ